MNFYFDLYGHVDGALRELIRSKLSTLFKATLRDTGQGKDEPGEERDADQRCVMGGDEKLVARIVSSKKPKQIMPPAVNKSYQQQQF